jgi:hypothetical protein
MAKLLSAADAKQQISLSLSFLLYSTTTTNLS